eukprot:4714948-Pleurochrysis_carterae.AAC.1
MHSLDGTHVPARDVAQFVAAAGGNQEAEGAVLAALEAAVAGGDAAATAREDAGAADAGEACLRALRDALDALGATGRRWPRERRTPSGP